MHRVRFSQINFVELFVHWEYTFQSVFQLVLFLLFEFLELLVVVVVEIVVVVSVVAVV